MAVGLLDEVNNAWVGGAHIASSLLRHHNPHFNQGFRHLEHFTAVPWFTINPTYLFLNVFFNASHHLANFWLELNALWTLRHFNVCSEQHRVAVWQLADIPEGKKKRRMLASCHLQLKLTVKVQANLPALIARLISMELKLFMLTLMLTVQKVISTTKGEYSWCRGCSFQSESCLFTCTDNKCP